MGKRSKKGGRFEREFSRTLSLWWSYGQDDDLFWRTDGSGGRGTVRAKRGLATRKAADVGATDASGAPLMRRFAFELKCGYNQVHVGDLVAHSLARHFGKAPPPPVWLRWADQAEAARKNCGALFWAVVHKRDGRAPVVLFPAGALEPRHLRKGKDGEPRSEKWRPMIQIKLRHAGEDRLWEFCRLSSLLSEVIPSRLGSPFRPRLL